MSRPRKPWETDGDGGPKPAGQDGSKGKQAAPSELPTTVLPDYSIDAQFPPPAEEEDSGSSQDDEDTTDAPSRGLGELNLSS